MSAKKATAVDLNKPYEENVIGLKGIVGFTIGLVLLILVTHLLMWSFVNVLEDYWEENSGPKNPLAMSDIERLPPEPRLQGAPAFGVESEHGRVNLELMEPQAEYRELKKQWVEIWEDGHTDEKTGVVTVRPIDQAKKMLLEKGVNARSGAEAEETLRSSKTFLSEASSGRVASETRR